MQWLDWGDLANLEFGNCTNGEYLTLPCVVVQKMPQSLSTMRDKKCAAADYAVCGSAWLLATHISHLLSSCQAQLTYLTYLGTQISHLLSSCQAQLTSHISSNSHISPALQLPGTTHISRLLSRCQAQLTYLTYLATHISHISSNSHISPAIQLPGTTHISHISSNSSHLLSFRGSHLCQ